MVDELLEEPLGFLLDLLLHGALALDREHVLPLVELLVLSRLLVLAESLERLLLSALALLALSLLGGVFGVLASATQSLGLRLLRLLLLRARRAASRGSSAGLGGAPSASSASSLFPPRPRRRRAPPRTRDARRPPPAVAPPSSASVLTLAVLSPSSVARLITNTRPPRSRKSMPSATMASAAALSPVMTALPLPRASITGTQLRADPPRRFRSAWAVIPIGAVFPKPEKSVGLGTAAASKFSRTPPPALCPFRDVGRGRAQAHALRGEA